MFPYLLPAPHPLLVQIILTGEHIRGIFSEERRKSGEQWKEKPVETTWSFETGRANSVEHCWHGAVLIRDPTNAMSSTNVSS